MISKLKFLVKYFILAFIALVMVSLVVSCVFITSTEAETDTPPPSGVNTSDPVLFAGNNTVEAVYGNSGAAEDYHASGRLNPNFANAAGYSFARLQFNGADLTNGAVFTGDGIDSGSVTNLADVDGSGTAAYTYRNWSSNWSNRRRSSSHSDQSIDPDEYLGDKLNCCVRQLNRR